MMQPPWFVAHVVFLTSLLSWPLSARANSDVLDCDPPTVADIVVCETTDDGPGWNFQRSRYSHDPRSGEMVTQYAQKEPSYVLVDPTYRRSGYRHRRLNWRGPDGSADRLHLVDEWGAGREIRPYGEWQRPFRAGATPYGPWGNPQGPWTTPFESWINPFASWNWYPYYPYYPHYPVPYSDSGYGHGGHRPRHGVTPQGAAPRGMPPHGPAPYGGGAPGPLPHGPASQMGRNPMPRGSMPYGPSSARPQGGILPGSP